MKIQLNFKYETVYIPSIIFKDQGYSSGSSSCQVTIPAI